MTKERILFIDYLRVIACFMVMLVHSCEPFYLGGEGTLILNRTNGVIVTLIDSLLRPCVPLFVMASSYLLFPIKGECCEFFRKRFKRVAIPLIIWVLLYALIPLYGSTYEFYKSGSVLNSLKQSIFNFPGAAGHLWFVYMLLGIYLVMPIFSAWIEKVSKKGEQCFILLWLFTTTIPFLRLLSGGNQVWGEANWNEFGLFYGVSGFIGYVILAHYFRKYLSDLSWKKTILISIPLIIIGYSISAGWFWNTMPKEFPVESTIDLAVYMETGWGFCTSGTALITIGFFLIIKKLNGDNAFYRHFILPISGASYGMYLMHIFFLCFFTTVFQNAINSTLLVIFLTALCSYGTSFAVSYLLGRVPKLGKYIVG